MAEGFTNEQKIIITGAAFLTVGSLLYVSTHQNEVISTTYTNPIEAKSETSLDIQQQIEATRMEVQRRELEIAKIQLDRLSEQEQAERMQSFADRFFDGGINSDYHENQTTSEEPSIQFNYKSSPAPQIDTRIKAPTLKESEPMHNINKSTKEDKQQSDPGKALNNLKAKAEIRRENGLRTAGKVQEKPSQSISKIDKAKSNGVGFGASRLKPKVEKKTTINIIKSLPDKILPKANKSFGSSKKSEVITKHKENNPKSKGFGSKK
jgi:hypothetical protein